MTPAEWASLRALLERARIALCEGRDEERKGSAAA
jgi:hypothetical protein